MCVCTYIQRWYVEKLLPHEKQKSVGKAVRLCFVAFVLVTTIYTTSDVGVCS